MAPTVGHAAAATVNNAQNVPCSPRGQHKLFTQPPILHSAVSLGSTAHLTEKDNFNTLTNCLGLNSTGKQELKTAQVPPFWCYSVEQCGAVQCVVEMCSAAAAATAGTPPWPLVVC